MTLTMWTQQLTTALERAKIVTVMVVDEVEDAVQAARALVRGGVTHLELTLRTERAVDAVKAVVDSVPQMTVGAGTVLTVQQLEQVKAAGAAFAVAPGFNPKIVAAADQLGIPFAPGIATPSEIEAAYEAGCRLLKLFPATPLGGVSYLKSVNAAYGHLGLQYIPLGGVSQTTMSDWLGLPEVLAVGGSWLAKRDLIKAQQWDEIERRARDAATHIAALSGSNGGAV